jgi:hypothetical protein
MVKVKINEVNVIIKISTLLAVAGHFVWPINVIHTGIRIIPTNNRYIKYLIMANFRLP